MTKDTASTTGQITQLPISQLSPHPDNPRKSIGDVAELAESIKANGILQNLTVVPNIDGPEYGYTVIIGHRRLAAAKLAGLNEVPCVVARMDRREQLQTMLLENMQRSDLTVYEQAQGFQMMLDLGDTVEEIAEKSGFSKATVRRRVKMMELDQEVLKEVSSRQLSLGDFDRLAQVEDIEERNACLAEIGTSEFNQKIKTSLRRQAVKKNLPIVKELIKKAKAKALKQSETWNGKYDRLGDTLYLADWKDGESLIPQKVSGKLYYCLDEEYGYLRFFEEHKRPAPVKRPDEEIEREKRIDTAWNAINEKTATAYSLRSAFVQDLTWGPKNAEPILQGALIAATINAMAYIGADKDAIKDILGLGECSGYLSELMKKSLDSLKTLDSKKIPLMVYALFGDSEKEGYACGYRKRYPQHEVSPKLEALYYWLTTLGYEMSAEEKELRDGTHELFQNGKEETTP